MLVTLILFGCVAAAIIAIPLFVSFVLNKYSQIISSLYLLAALIATLVGTYHAAQLGLFEAQPDVVGPMSPVGNLNRSPDNIVAAILLVSFPLLVYSGIAMTVAVHRRLRQPTQ